MWAGAGRERKGHRSAGRIRGYIVFMKCVSTKAGRRRGGGGCPRRVHWDGSWSLFSILPSGAVVAWRRLVLSLWKYPSRDINDRRICCCGAHPPVKFQSDWRIISISRLRHFTKSLAYSLLNRASTSRVVVLMKTKCEPCPDMKTRF